MIIEPFKNYVVTCKDSRGTIYRWHLEVFRWKNAWKVVNTNIVVGQNFKGYWILDVRLEEYPSTMITETLHLFSDINYSSEDTDDWDENQDYWDSCPQCGGYIGIDGQCHSCGFDWDSCYGD